MPDTLDKKLQGFQLIAQEKLQAIICSIPGKKDLILEPTLIKPLEHICSASWLKLKGIQRIYKYDAQTTIPRGQDNVQVYMIRSQLQTFSRLLKQVHEHEARLPTDTNAAIKNFHVICVPSCFSYWQTLLEQEGLYGLVQMHRYNWDLIYLDSGVMSMDITNLFASVFMQGDTSLLPAVAQSLRILQMVCGRPEVILSYGDHAANIVKMLQTLGACPQPPAGNDSDFGALLIIDRDKDYASSLLSPAIYSALLLEVFNFRTGDIELETNSNKILRQKLQMFLLPEQQKQQQSSQQALPKCAAKSPIIRLNALTDEIYGENRYKHFAQASSLVRAQAKTIGLEVQKLNEMKLDEMHDYVARKLPKITELKSKLMRHLKASERVIEMLGANFQRVQSLEEQILNNISRKQLLQEIDELLTIDGQQYNTLRLLCLLHLSAGLSADELATFVRNYCNYFGNQHVAVFAQLCKAGLLPALEPEKPLNKSAKLLSSLPLPKFQQTEFQANANRLKLLVAADSSGGNNQAEADANAALPTSPSASKTTNGVCPSYVFNGLYIPLIAQLSSLLLRCCSAEELSSRLGMLDKLQLHLSPSFSTASHSAKSLANAVRQSELKDVLPLRKRNVMVFVVGGVTYSEIGACDLVARQMGAHIVVASDSIVSGADLMAAAF